VPRSYPVPLELRDEDKVVGNWLSMRQIGILAGGVAAGVVSGGVIFGILRLLGASKGLGLGVAAVPLVVCVGVAAVLAFLPAGWMGILPGPEQPVSPDPNDPPMRIDQWLKLWRAFGAKPRLLPYRREGYEQQAPLYHKALNGGKGRRTK